MNSISPLNPIPSSLGEGGFSLGSLGLVTDLLFNRTPSAENQGSYLGDVALADGNTDISVFVDRSANRTIENTRTSDFSSGTDGITASGSNSVAGNVDSINGEDNWLELTPSAIAQQHEYYIPASWFTGWGMVVSVSVIRRRIKCYIGVASVATGWALYTPNWRSDVPVVATTEYFMDVYELYHSTQLVKFSPGVVGMENDRMYNKDHIVDHIGGNHFIQASASKKAHANFSDYTADFDGVANEFTDDGSFTAAIKGDTAGMFTMFIRDDEGLGNIMYLMSIWQANTMQIEPYIGADNKFWIVIKDSVNGNNSMKSVETVTRGGWLTLQFGSDGANFHCIVDGVTLTWDTGTDNGDWIGDLATEITKVTLGVGWGNAFGSFGLRHIGYKSGGVFTAQEITNINALPEYQPIYAP